MKNNATEVFIIGGGEIYAHSIQYWNKIYITEVDFKCEGTVYFPTIDFKDWKLISSEAQEADEKNKWPFWGLTAPLPIVIVTLFSIVRCLQ